MSRVGGGLVSISIDAGKLARAERKLRDIKGGIDKAIVRAVNETAKEVKTEMSSRIRDEVNIKKRDIDKKIVIYKGSSKFQAAKIRMSASRKHRIGLKYFGARQSAKGVTYAIRKGGGRTLIEGAFGPKIPRLGRQVFKRVGKQRLPLKGPLKGPSPWAVFVMSGMQDGVIADGEERMAKNLNQAVEFLILKQKGKI